MTQVFGEEILFQEIKFVTKKLEWGSSALLEKKFNFGMKRANLKLLFTCFRENFSQQQVYVLPLPQFSEIAETMVKQKV